MKVKAHLKKRSDAAKKQQGLEKEEAVEIHGDLKKSDLRKKKAYDSLSQTVAKYKQ
jgi:hypothetical protein